MALFKNSCLSYNIFNQTQFLAVYRYGRCHVNNMPKCMLIMDCLKWTEKQHESARQRFYGCLEAVCVNFITCEICNYLAYINSQAGVCTLK